jgi:hypothetical protein
MNGSLFDLSSGKRTVMVLLPFVMRFVVMRFVVVQFVVVQFVVMQFVVMRLDPRASEAQQALSR